MGTNQQDFARAWVTESENYLFFQKTPFLCLLNVKQTKIRGYYFSRMQVSKILKNRGNRIYPCGGGKLKYQRDTGQYIFDQ
jgi:hypothetical protein